MIQVEQLPLWDVLKSDKVEDSQRAKVKELIEHAAAILDRVIETFPTYTLHNSTHAVNVVKRMADLLGPHSKKLTPLEAAFLLLSAFYHDIGMVFRQEERNQLTQEPDWKNFLKEKPDAYMAVKKAGDVPLDIAEWYCRWRHADRVYVYLNHLPDDLLKWGQTSIREELGEVCRSHNLDAFELHKFRTDFRGEADLRFCAVLLRLADILDFDRTRTPEAVYEYLGLIRRSEPRASASDVEWQKHLCSEGFQFPAKRSDGYRLAFIAGPDEPGVEHELREFLTVIEGEVKQCRALLSNCSERWRLLPLPGSIDRSNIHGNGYRYGEYRFSLDQEQVMDLLMGENLYVEPYVFVRELIQNALDASRHRRFIERAQGNSEFEPKPIQVRHWIDRDGYQWVRFDDDGMGMDEEIINDHLLKVGSSYYRTASFRAEILRAQAKTQENFVPISRFGIGLLSCFIAGDQVEITTLHRTKAGGKSQPIRLSLNGLHGFFTLQTPQLRPTPMPDQGQEETEYRLEPGTSIAVRLDPTKEKGTFNPEALLKKYVTCPTIPVEFAGERLGGDPAFLVDRPWCKRTLVTVEPSEIGSLGQRLRRVFFEPVQVEFLPIDLTKHSPTPDLKGQFILAVLHPSQELLEFVTRIEEFGRVYFALEYELKDKPLQLSYQITLTERPVKKIPADLYLILSRQTTQDSIIFGAIQPPVEKEVKEILLYLRTGRFAWLSHNGVAVLTDPGQPDLGISSSLRPGWTAGIIALADSLRPDLSVSRERLRGLPSRFYSTLGLTLYRGLAAAGVDISSKILGGLLRSQRIVLLGDLMSDDLLRPNGPWSSIPIVRTNNGMQSVQEICSCAEHEPVELLDLPLQGERHSYLAWCAATLVQLELNVFVELDKKIRLFVSREPVDLLTDAHRLFPPLTFLPFRESRALRSYSRVINLNHPFSAWLLDKAPEIARRYPGLFERIRDALIFEVDYGEQWHNQRETLNATLDRLRELHPSIRPPKNLVLKEEDILDFG